MVNNSTGRELHKFARYNQYVTWYLILADTIARHGGLNLLKWIANGWPNVIDTIYHGGQVKEL